jgi:hypothetical protein
MNELSDSEFCSWLDTLQAGGNVPDGLPADDAADLVFASRLLGLQLTMRANPLSLAQLVEAGRRSANENQPGGRPAVWRRAIQTVRRLAGLQSWPVPKPAGPLSARWRVGLSLAGLAALLVLITVVYPPARALADQIIQKITFGRITVIAEDVTEVAPTPEQPPEDNFSTLWTPANLADVQAKYPALASLPGWVPSGYTRQERVALFYHDSFGTSPDYATYEWTNSQDDSIQLTIFTGACYHGSSYDPAVGCNFQSFISSDPAHPVVLTKVNGQTAALLQGGGWRQDFSVPARQWNPTHYRPNPDNQHALELIWEKGPAEFMLSASSDNVPKNDLVRMAESIP